MKLNNLDYWVELRKITTARIAELEDMFATNRVNKKFIWFTNRVLESNREWHNLAVFMINDINRKAEAIANRANLATRTFRANDD